MKIINDELHSAAKKGDEESLKSVLLNPTCDALATDGDGMTALMYAALHGHISCTQILLPVAMRWQRLTMEKPPVRLLRKPARRHRESH